MKNIATQLCIFIGIFSVLSSSCIGSSSPFSSLLGVAPQDAKYYKTEFIKCRDGSKKFTSAQLNDDFCDCPDGTDEPGTSACPRGKFYCHNEGHLPISLFSSSVNDGICDCCDGSDEYDGKVNCPNTCWEAGKAARESIEGKIAMYKEGLSIRNQEVEKGKLAFAEDKAQLSKLKSEEKTLKRLVKKLEAHKEQIEKAEEKERLQKQKNNTEERTKEGAEEVKNDDNDNNTDGVKGTLEASDDHKVGLAEEAPQDQHERESSKNTELPREELGRLVSSRWTGEKRDDQAKEIDTSGDKLGENDKTTESVQSEGNHVHAKEHEENTKNEDVNHVSSSVPYNPESQHPNDSAIKTLSSPSWWDKIQKSIRNTLQSVNLLPTPVNILDGDNIRKEYDDSSARLSDVKSEISVLTKKLKHDFGAEKEFYSFYDRCFETKHNKYVYKVCPFNKATQENEHGATWLGSWDKFDNQYSVMLFSNGAGCWNGPNRSLKVNLRCGLETELNDIDEPSRCEYSAVLSNPVDCRKEKLKELERELDSLNIEKPQGHDEL